MNINEAIAQLKLFIAAYENTEVRRLVISKHGDISGCTKDYLATKTIVEEYYKLSKEVEMLREKVEDDFKQNMSRE